MKKELTVLILTLCQMIAFSQYENKSYYSENQNITFSKRKIAVVFQNNNFIKNNEYFSGQSLGFTFIGTEIQPEIVIGISTKTRLFVGWNSLYYFGSNKLQRSQPVFRMDYYPAKDLQITMGEIRGKLDHQLIEPMYSFDNYFLLKPEYGFRCIFNDSTIKNDYWIDWQQFLDPNSAGFEQFVMGDVFTYSFLNSRKFSFSLNSQFIGKHIGGQSVNANIAIQSYFNFAPGLEIRYAFQSGFLKKIRLNSWYILSASASDTNALPFKSGNGFYNTLLFESKNLDLMLGWWKANTYFSPLGEYLYQSVSNYQRNFIDIERFMLTAKLLYNLQLEEGVNLGLRMDTYLDLQKMDFNYFYGINLITKINSH